MCVQGIPLQLRPPGSLGDAPAPRNTFLERLVRIDVGSKKFSSMLAKMLASEEGLDTAMSLQGDDALTFVNILGQVSGPKIIRGLCLTPAQALETPNMELDLRKKSVHILQRICGSQTILPRHYTLSGDISKEGDVLPGPGGFAHAWEGRHNGNRVCVKAFRSDTAGNFPKIKQVCSK